VLLKLCGSVKSPFCAMNRPSIDDSLSLPKFRDYYSLGLSEDTF